MERGDKEYIGRLLMLGATFTHAQWMEERDAALRSLGGDDAMRHITHDLSAASGPRPKFVDGKVVKGRVRYFLTDAAKAWFAEGGGDD